MSANHRRPALQAADQLLWKLVQLEDTLSDFSEDQQEVLEVLLNQYTETLGKLQSCCSLLEDNVPLDLVSFLDEGGNPDVFTRELFVGCVAANQEAKGKVLAFRQLSQELSQGLKGAYPKEHKAFEGMSSLETVTIEEEQRLDVREGDGAKEQSGK